MNQKRQFVEKKNGRSLTVQKILFDKAIEWKYVHLCRKQIYIKSLPRVDGITPQISTRLWTNSLASSRLPWVECLILGVSG